jgi:hypothetical protein
MKTSDSVQSEVRFEARIWREAITGSREERQPDYSFRDVPVEFEPEWAIYSVKTGLRLKYCSTDQAAAEAYAAKWNSGKVPTDIEARDESATYLLTVLKPGAEVKTILRSCSRSGMSRRISLVVAIEDNVQDITWHAARAMGEATKQGGRYVQDGGLVVGGCGMDMGFHVVYNLSRTLFPDGFPIADGIAPNGHKMTTGNFRGNHAKPLTPQDMAEYVRKGWKFHGRNGDKTGWDKDGGYALKQRWL